MKYVAALTMLVILAAALLTGPASCQSSNTRA
jgi:hypothetical protein